LPALLRPVRALLLAGPFALAFASGGFTGTARLVALVVATVLLVFAALVADVPLPRSTCGRVALGGLALLAGWVALSHSWAPLPDRAADDLQRVLLYLAALATAAAVFRGHDALGRLEPALAAGTFVVIGYGLAGKLLPGIVTQNHSSSAGGRLEQPLTYWNAEGALAAMGFVLCAHLAGERSRSPRVRALAAAAAVPLLAGVYLSFSRGALAAMGGGLVVLLLLAPTWSQLRAVAICVEAGLAGAVACGVAPGVRAMHGSLSSQEGQGAIVLVVLLAIMLIAAVTQTHACRVEREERVRMGPLPLPRAARVLAMVAAVAIVLVPAALAKSSATPRGGPAFGAQNQRLSTLGSNRHQYWRVALDTFADHPLKGSGSGGFAAEWLQARTIDETVRDAHSLELETLAELGLVGFALLAAFLLGVALCARRALLSDPAPACGAVAALAVWALHSAIDWDWEMPAVTLVAIVLAGALIAAGDEGSAPRRRPWRAPLMPAPPPPESA
jgi:hypothetical protein